MLRNALGCKKNQAIWECTYFISCNAFVFRSVLRPARRPSHRHLQHRPRISSSATHDAVAVGHPFSDKERCHSSRHAALKHKELAPRCLVFGDVAAARQHVRGPHLFEQLAEAVLRRDALDLGDLVLV